MLPPGLDIWEKLIEERVSSCKMGQPPCQSKHEEDDDDGSSILLIPLWWDSILKKKSALHPYFDHFIKLESDLEGGNSDDVTLTRTNA